MPNISISVKNKIAVQTNRTLYVCGNSDYTAIFDLDAEWNAFEIKTARFCYNGHYSDVVFTGNECEIPVIADTNEFEIGLFAGNLHTTTPAMVLCERSILSTSGTPTNPSPDVYHQLIEKINSGMLRGPQGEKGDPGKDAPQIDDGTISRDSPWSSRQIIDTLCPALEETGNPVTCYPVAGYPLGVVASWEPIQAGTGDPSPENIRPISGRDTVSVERCGKNLLQIAPFAKIVNKGITFEYVAPGGIKISGTATGLSDSPVSVAPLLPPGKYYGTNQNNINASIVVTRDGARYWQNAKGIFDIKTGDILHYWYISINAGTTIDTIIYPYIVPGTTAPTAYTPYQGDTLTLALPSTIYGGEVDAASGECKRTWRVLTLTGKEPAHIFSKFFYLDFYKQAHYVIEIPYDAHAGKCSHYGYALYGSKKVGITSDGDSMTYAPEGQYSIDNQGLQEWKSYLAAQYAAGTPVQVAYKLKTPTPITATGAQPIQALAGCNTILTDADTVTITGRADPAHTIAALQAQLDTVTQQLVETQAAVVDTTAAIVDYVFEQDCDAIGGGEDADAE